MARFKEVTLVGGINAIINLDEVKVVQRAGTSTTVSFDLHHVIHVEETLAELLAEPIDGRL